MFDIQLMGLLNATLQAATLLFIAALGELITEKSGILNLGVEGMISVGAVSGFMVAVNTGNLFLSVLIGIFSAALCSSLHAFVTVILKQDQTVSGLILTILGLSLSALMGKKYVGKKLPVKIESLIDIDEPSNIYEVLISQNYIFYLAIFLMVATSFILKKTMFGRRLEAVGEDSRAADSMGLNVNKTQFIATCVGGGFSGLAGVYLTLSYVPYWTDNMTSGRGWIALVLYVFDADIWSFRGHLSLFLPWRPKQLSHASLGLAIRKRLDMDWDSGDIFVDWYWLHHESLSHRRGDLCLDL